VYNNFLTRNRYEWMAMLSNALHGNTSDKLNQLKNVYAKQLSEAPDN
jgi:hypothetical protein